jgi:Family of unknown function (DUF5990)/Domain of unknown function (DUF5655)
MPQLPDRPDLDQLRRQARELLRAAQDGDPAALRRLQAVSDKATLSTAQLALAREYGFPGWRRLADEVERRRAALEDPERSAPESAVPVPPESAVPSPQGSATPSPPKSWQEVTQWSARLLADRTGQDVAAWNRRVAETAIADEASLRAWLAGQGVTGYAQALLVWERFGYPDFLTADADELIAGQYADRPGLRPVLDAVLAALPPLGPVTVQARKTIVSLVSPRRTFAAVQATTKSRVDLGLRLADVKPEGRLLAARNINVGAVNLMVALTGPGEVDEEVLGWLRRAYDESVGPAVPRRPARRPGPALGTLTVLIEGSDLPGRTWCPGPDGPAYQNVHVALHGHDDGRSFLPMPGRGGWLAIEPVPADAPSARWEMPVTVRQGDAGLDFGGPFVRGDRTDRHIALAWGEVPGDGTLRLFRACKFGLAGVDPGLVEDALRPGRRLVARVRLTGARGSPGCADLAWSIERAP